MLYRNAIYRGSQLPVDCARAVGKFRYNIFIRQLGWSLPCREDDAEWDQYDTDGTIHIVVRDARDAVCGYARLLPTRGGRYMLKELFSHLMPNDAPPDCHGVWELSRIAVSVPQPAPEGERNEILRILLATAATYAMRHGVQRLLGVTYVGVERLFRRLGIHTHRAGPPVEMDGRMVIAGWIELDRQTGAALHIGEACLRSVPIEPKLGAAGDWRPNHAYEGRFAAAPALPGTMNGIVRPAEAAERNRPAGDSGLGKTPGA